MAGKSPYTEQDKARVFVCLRANAGNIKRTSRDTGITSSTIRRWRDEWETNQVTPPDVSLVAVEATGFIEDAERVRNKALSELERKIPTATPSALVATVGMLSDKIALVRGLATTRVEHHHQLPAPEEVKELIQGFVRGAIEASHARQGEIIDAEVLAIEPPDKS